MRATRALRSLLEQAFKDGPEGMSTCMDAGSRF
jgi:hypothetical protein